jgi:hypothetical protein
MINRAKVSKTNSVILEFITFQLNILVVIVVIRGRWLALEICRRESLIGRINFGNFVDFRHQFTWILVECEFNIANDDDIRCWKQIERLKMTSCSILFAKAHKNFFGIQADNVEMLRLAFRVLVVEYAL